MMRTRLTVIGVLALLALGPRSLAAAAGEAVAVVVNKANPIQNLTLAELKKIFLAQKGHWADGKAIVIVIQDPGRPERIALLRDLYQMSEADLSKYFLQASFTGELQSTPKTAPNGPGVRRLVATLPGAVGIVRASEVDDTVKVIRVDGRAPGEPGYKIAFGS